MDQLVTELKLSHIVACARGRVIGQAGALPWHIPEDFKLFKRVTSGHVLIMGRKTFESIGRPLPGRLSLVVTRNAAWSAPGALAFPSVAAALQHAASVRDTWSDEVFIIGGGELFAETLPQVQTVYYSEVPLDVAGDTFYPELPDSFYTEHEEVVAGIPPFTWRILKRS